MQNNHEKIIEEDVKEFNPYESRPSIGIDLVALTRYAKETGKTVKELWEKGVIAMPTEPLYERGSHVKFEYNGEVLQGRVDASGTMGQTEPSYNIMIGTTLCQHVPESAIIGLAEYSQFSRDQLNRIYAEYWRELRIFRKDLENLERLDPAAGRLHEHVEEEIERVSKWMDDDWWRVDGEDPDFTKTTPSERAAMEQADEELAAGIYFTEEEVWKPEIPDLSAAYEAIETAAKTRKPVQLPSGTELKLTMRWDRQFLVEDLFWLDERGVACRAVLEPELHKGKDTEFIFPGMYVVICVTEDGFSSGNTKVFRKENRKEGFDGKERFL